LLSLQHNAALMSDEQIYCLKLKFLFTKLAIDKNILVGNAVSSMHLLKSWHLYFLREGKNDLLLEPVYLIGQL
jgi:hypothetical protein